MMMKAHRAPVVGDVGFMHVLAYADMGDVENARAARSRLARPCRSAVQAEALILRAVSWTR